MMTRTIFQTGLHLASLLLILGVVANSFALIPDSSSNVETNLVKTDHEEKPVLEDGRCLVGRGRKSKKYFHYGNTTTTIVLETTVNRLEHQLVTTIFKIILTEVLGYVSVEIKQFDDNFNATKTLQRLSLPRDGIFDSMMPPEAMVNVGLRLPSDIPMEDWIKSESKVQSCGHLGFSGRYGWFMVRSPFVERNTNLQFILNFMPINNVTSRFSLSSEDLFQVEMASRTGPGRYYCEESYCHNGSFSPTNCIIARHNGTFQCAVLLADYPEAAPFLHKQIQKYNLSVQVIFLGPNLERVVNELAKKYRYSESQGILFFTWTPSMTTVGLDLVSVAFPNCEPNCLYNLESRKLEKVVWSALKAGANPAYEALHRISFTHEEYLNLLGLAKNETSMNPIAYSRRSSLENAEIIACKWLKANPDILESWTPFMHTKKTKIIIGGIFPMQGSYTAKSLVQAAIMAKQAVNNDPKILEDYELDLKASDGGCRSDIVMRSFINYIKLDTFEHLAGILGPACSDTVEPLVGVARHFKVVVISYSAEGSTYSDREKYPFFFRTIAENKQYQPVYLQLLNTLGWKRISSLTEEGQKLAEYVSSLQDLLSNSNKTFVINRKIPRDRTPESMSQYLVDLKTKKARIIIGDFYDSTAREVMCEAMKQKMTAREGYVWFLPTWFSPDWYNTDKHNLDPANAHVNCTTQEMLQAINGHLSLQYAYYAPDDHIMQENKTVRKWREEFELACARRNLTASDYGGYAYDAVWTYAYALDKLLKESPSAVGDLHSNHTTIALVNNIQSTDFYGVSGRINFVGGPSRTSVIHVVQWRDKKKHIVGYFDPDALDAEGKQNGRFELNQSAITWYTPNGNIPEDGTEPPETCVLDSLATALDVKCEVAIVIANVIGFGILGMVLVMCFVVIKRRYDRRVQMTQDYLKDLGFDVNATTILTVDKYEIPRDRVVLNRKLGEGAFGTVYGGECFFDDKGWVGVAVKTLKVGSTCEQKLDFLSEADVMKRFDHKNIVKLLGVCTKVEPVYTIMEFMLYGDLKTYLLERRHLVNDRSYEESDEVSCKRLTTMCLDIARALSYLAELKYVHRDVACRNCLVSASRIVKLGDFGMTRPMYENDYYRFNRKGMLPVRWMAPESLALGIFTPMSDVWSFGVVLYEVITFGSFPFQGLSNNQVLEQVKCGATISIPAGVKPHLEQLLKSCWSMESQKRPQAALIVEFLANNPRIISPCLDIPLASVQMEGTDQLEIQIPEKFRKVNPKSIPKHTRISRPLLDMDSGLNSPEMIPLSPNGHPPGMDKSSPYATLQTHNHESDLI